MVAEFVVTSTEASGGLWTLEASHRSVSSFDPAMVLLDPIVQIPVGSVFYSHVQFRPYRAWITVMTVRCDTRRNHAGHGFGRSKERLRRRHVASLAQPDVDQGTRTIDRAVQIAPTAIDFNVRLVGVPALSNPAFPSPTQTVDQEWGKLRLPVANRLMAELNSPDQKHLRQITQAQLVPESPEHHECDDVGRILCPVQNTSAALIKLLATNAAPEAPVTPGRPLWSFGNLFRVALDAPHFPFPHAGGSYADGPLPGQSNLARSVSLIASRPPQPWTKRPSGAISTTDGAGVPLVASGGLFSVTRTVVGRE